MRIAFIGTGYVGLVSGTCFAELGATVICIDKDKGKIASLQNGAIPIFEPGLAELVAKNRKNKRLQFTDALVEGVRDAEIIFIAVGTPTDNGTGNADLSYVYAAAEDLAPHIRDGAVIVIKSTVPVGTGRKVQEIVAKKCSGTAFAVASNPEFLREGCAVNDFLYPDRIIVGTESEQARRKLEALYKPLTGRGVPILFTDVQTAELTKYAANAFLATKIAFINEMADMCEKMAANVADVAKGMGMDHRIGENYLSPGPGFGGSCFPKDILALRYMAKEYKTGEHIISSVITSNEARKDNMARKVIAAMDGKVEGKTIAILGLAFKANTDDVRESPAISIVGHLLEAGARLQAFDPQAMDEARKILPEGIHYMNDAYEALDGADAAVIITEWAEFATLDLKKAKDLLKRPCIVDMRNLFNPVRMRERGFDYHSIGRVLTDENKKLKLVAHKKSATSV